MKLITTREITTTECPWLEKDIPSGTTVYRYEGPTYGCVGSGMAVALSSNKGPFFEIPKGSVRIA